MSIRRLTYLIRRLVMFIRSSHIFTIFAKICQSPRPLNSHALTHISDRALLLYQVRVPIQMQYLETSNPLQGQVGEHPHQHVEPLLVLLLGLLHGSIDPTKGPLAPPANPRWVEVSIVSYCNPTYLVVTKVVRCPF